MSLLGLSVRFQRSPVVSQGKCQLRGHSLAVRPLAGLFFLSLSFLMCQMRTTMISRASLHRRPGNTSHHYTNANGRLSGSRPEVSVELSSLHTYVVPRFAQPAPCLGLSPLCQTLLLLRCPLHRAQRDPESPQPYHFTFSLS